VVHHPVPLVRLYSTSSATRGVGPGTLLLGCSSHAQCKAGFRNETDAPWTVSGNRDRLEMLVQKTRAR
jgi:hypothetical protein